MSDRSKLKIFVFECLNLSSWFNCLLELIHHGKTLSFDWDNTLFEERKFSVLQSSNPLPDRILTRFGKHTK